MYVTNPELIIYPLDSYALIPHVSVLLRTTGKDAADLKYSFLNSNCYFLLFLYICSFLLACFSIKYSTSNSGGTCCYAALRAAAALPSFWALPIHLNEYERTRTGVFGAIISSLFLEPPSNHFLGFSKQPRPSIRELCEGADRPQRRTASCAHRLGRRRLRRGESEHNPRGCEVAAVISSAVTVTRQQSSPCVLKHT